MMNERDRTDKLRRADDVATESEPDVAPLRLLPGEDPATPYLEEAEHWEAVYRELEHFIESLAEELPQAKEAPPDQPSLEHDEDERLWQVKLQDLRAHRHYWEHRRRWIASNGGRGGIRFVDHLEQG